MENSIRQFDDVQRKQALRKFGFVMGGMIGLLFGLLFPWLWSLRWPSWPWVLVSAFWMAATVYPLALGGIYTYWMRFAEVLGWVNTRIILGLVFFCVFSPLGLTLRLFGRDTLQKRWDHRLKTYRIDTVPRKAEHMERQF